MGCILAFVPGNIPVSRDVHIGGLDYRCPTELLHLLPPCCPEVPPRRPSEFLPVCKKPLAAARGSCCGSCSVLLHLSYVACAMRLFNVGCSSDPPLRLCCTETSCAEDRHVLLSWAHLVQSPDMDIPAHRDVPRNEGEDAVHATRSLSGLS